MPRVDVASRSVGEALAAGRRRLADAGCDSPRLDAELLLAEVLDPAHPDRGRLVVDRDVVLPPVAAERFAGLLARREPGSRWPTSSGGAVSGT